MPDELAMTADQQLGLLTRAQCKAAGVTVGELRWSSGRTTRVVLRGVIALFAGELNDRQRLVAAALYAGERAQLSGLSAVRWHGIGDVPDDARLRFLVPAQCGVRSSGFVVVTRTTRPDPRPWNRGLLQICSPARALVDAARELRHPGTVRGLIISAVQRGHVRADHLQAEVEAGAMRGSVQSREYHQRDELWEATVAADTLLGEHGIPVIAVTPRGFAADPIGFVARLERAYRELQRSGRRPDVRMRPRGPGVLLSR